MGDLISRKKAIEAIVNTPSQVQYKQIPITDQYDGATFRQIEILGILDTLPSAEQKTGRWLWDEDETYYRCSECGHLAYETLYCMDGTYAYCPFCGAKMEGGEDE